MCATTLASRPWPFVCEVVPGCFTIRICTKFTSLGFENDGRETLFHASFDKGCNCLENIEYNEINLHIHFGSQS